MAYIIHQADLRLPRLDQELPSSLEELPSLLQEFLRRCPLLLTRNRRASTTSGKSECPTQKGRDLVSLRETDHSDLQELYTCVFIFFFINLARTINGLTN